MGLWLGFEEVLGATGFTAMDATKSQSSRRSFLRAYLIHRALCNKCFNGSGLLIVQEIFPADERRFLRRFAQIFLRLMPHHFLLTTYYLLLTTYNSPTSSSCLPFSLVRYPPVPTVPLYSHPDRGYAEIFRNHKWRWYPE